MPTGSLEQIESPDAVDLFVEDRLLQTGPDAGTGSQVRSVPMAPATWGMNLSSALGLSPLGPYHALMYGRSLYFDLARTQATLGWQPRYSNQEMICESYDWYLAHREEVLAGSGTSPHSSAVKQGVLGLVKRLL